jgi:hypothetical protein
LDFISSQPHAKAIIKQDRIGEFSGVPNERLHRAMGFDSGGSIGFDRISKSY